MAESVGERREDVKNRIEIARCLQDAVSSWLGSIGCHSYDFVSYEQNRVFSKKPDKNYVQEKLIM